MKEGRKQLALVRWYRLKNNAANMGSYEKGLAAWK
jgi:hypothetical protein